MKATFDADFSTFRGEVDKAVVQMKAFEGNTDNVSASLSKMVDNFSGRNIISEATLMAEAVERIGGASRLTEVELQRVANTAAQAAEKLRAWGQDVPRNIEELAGAASHASGTTQALHQSLTAFDSTLASLGFNIGTDIRGISELANAAGKTAAELGAISVAGLAVGAGIAGWKIGRAIAEFFDLDAKIANSTASLVGWGNVVGEVAAAKADVLARASQRAGREVTDITEAMTINKQVVDDWNAHWQRIGGPEQNRQQVAKWRTEIQSIKNDGVLALFTADLNSNNFSVAELAKSYAVSTGAVSLFKRELQDVAKEDAAWREAAFKNLERMNAADAKRAAQNKKDMEEYERGLLREFEIGLKVTAEAIKATDALNVKMEKKLALQTAFVASLIIESDKAKTVNTERNLGPAITNPADIAAAKRDAALAEIEASRARAPAFDFGPLIQKVWQDFDEQILKRGAAAAPSSPVTVNVSGVWDPSSVKSITDAVSAELMRRRGPG